jgi:large subunit ribosomal protein LP0
VAAAKAGAVAPKDVKVPAGPTGLEPTQTNFFQALGIATKIVKGTIEIITEVQLCTAGEKVGSSQAVLLTKLGVKPFEFGLKVIKVFSEGSVLDPAVLEVSNDDIVSLFLQAANRISAIGLKIGYPAKCAVPHMIVNSFKNLAAVAVSTEIDFKQAEKIKDIIKNPSKCV